MKLANADLFLEMEIEEDRPTVLVVEAPSVMANIIEDLYSLCNSGSGDFVLSDKGEVLSLEKRTEILINPFSIDFNSKKIQTKLYKEMLEAGHTYIQDKNQIQSMIVGYLDKVIQDVPYEMIVNNLNLDLLQLFKMYNVHLEPQCDTLLDRIIEYTKVMVRLLQKDFLILVNMCIYLSKNEISSLVEMCVYQKIKVLFIESCEHSFEFPVTSYIIDMDKCLIMK